MQLVLLADNVYESAKRRADEAGFESVDEYIASVLTDEDVTDTPNLDHLFTPERVADLQRRSAAIREGGVTYTMDQVDEHLAQHRAEWIRTHGN